MAGGKRGGQGGRGAKPGSHRKGALKGSGGQSARRLSGKGPTPPAEKRPGHPAAKRAAARKAVGKKGGKAGGDAASRATGKRSAPPRSRAPRSEGGRPDAPRSPSQIVAGRNPVVEALRAAVPATALYVATGLDRDARVREALDAAADRGVSVLEASRSEVDRLTHGAVHQGLALQVAPYSYVHPDDLLARARDSMEQPLIVALDGVTDPHNLGAVVRSVAAFGGHGVVVPERRSAGMTVSAWKASAGTAARVPVARATNLTRTLRSYADGGLLVVGLAADGDVDLPDLEAAVDAMVLVVGSEGGGLSRLVGEQCDIMVRIPIVGAESLNASVAAGVALYEVARRRAVV